ncbi:MAG: GDSL-type esterase/lipase family protein [Bacteroidota bacterium]
MLCRKNFFILSFSVILLVAMMSFIKPDKKKKIIFFGDSITQMGIKPNGYITQMDSMIKKEGIDNYQLEGAGIGGNKVYDLYLRMDADVLAKNPDIVFIYVGINDIWHKVTHGTGTDSDKFEVFYNAIIKKLTDRNIKVILCTPTVIGERNDYSNQQDGELNMYGNIIRNIAQKQSIPVCDLRTAFVKYLQENNPTNQEKGILTVDKVHLNDKGNVIVAQQMWKVIKEIK